jgi:tetratricopeptide (TPR) repeat protein
MPRFLQGNLAWAYMQQRNYMAAEAVYRKAQMVDPDANKACNLALCLIEQRRLADAELVLADVIAGAYNSGAREHGGKIVKKAEELLERIRAETGGGGGGEEAGSEDGAEADEMAELLDEVVRQWTAPYRRSDRRLPVFEEITPLFRQQMAC